MKLSSWERSCEKGERYLSHRADTGGRNRTAGRAGGIMPCRSYVNGNHVNGNKLEQGMAQRAVPAFR